MSILLNYNSSWVNKWGQKYSNTTAVTQKLEKSPRVFCKKFTYFLANYNCHGQDNLIDKVIRSAAEAGVFKVERLAKSEYAPLSQIYEDSTWIRHAQGLLKYGYPFLRIHEKMLLTLCAEAFPEDWKFRFRSDLLDAFEMTCRKGNLKNATCLYERLRRQGEIIWDPKSTLLVEVMKAGHQELAMQLVVWDLPDRPDSEGSFPIHVAAVEGWLSLVKWLVQRGTDTKVLDGEGLTAFEIAAYNGRTEIVEWLAPKEKVSFELALRANSKKLVHKNLVPMSQEDLKRELFGTAQEPKEWLFEIFNAGASYSEILLKVLQKLPPCKELFISINNQRNHFLRTIGEHSNEVIEEVFKKIPESFKSMVVNGVNEEWGTPLYAALRLKQPNEFLVTTLISEGVRPADRDFKEDSFLKMALKHGYSMSAIRQLLGICTETQKQALCNDETLLHELVRHKKQAVGEQDCIEILRYLIDLGANPFYKDKYNQNILDYAIRNDRFIVGRFLLETYSLNCNVHSQDGGHALHYLSIKNAWELFDEFRPQFIDFLDEPNKGGDTALSLALGEQAKEMAERLLQSNACTTGATFPAAWKNGSAFTDLQKLYEGRFVYDRAPLDFEKDDLTLMINKERFSDHQIILASSQKHFWINKAFIEARAPGLAALFGRNDKTQLYMGDEEAFVAVLYLIYGSKCPINVDNFKRLAKVAVEYEASFLVQRLSDWINDEAGPGFEEWGAYLKTPRGTKRKREGDPETHSKYIRSELAVKGIT